MGCTVQATVENGEVCDARGQACKRGVAFAREELLDPRRMLTATVALKGGVLRRSPVRSERPLPKAMLLRAAEVLRSVTLQAPVAQGQVVVADILGSGVDIIASRDIAAEVLS